MDFHLYLPLGDKGRAFPNSTHLGQAARFWGTAAGGPCLGSAVGPSGGLGLSLAPPRKTPLPRLHIPSPA